MSLNKITKTALEALAEVCIDMVKADGAAGEQVRDFLECVCYIIDDPDVQQGAGREAALGLTGAKWAIRRWLKKQKGS